jgi:hypothetical protein
LRAGFFLAMQKVYQNSSARRWILST